GGKSGQQQQQSQEQSQIKKQIEDAKKYQQQAEDKIRKDQRKDAPEDQDQALNKLREAQKKLEDLLRQLREEELERLLAKLEARCRHMLAMQIAVRDGTVELDKVIKANPKSEATRADQQASNELSDKENEIVKEARAGLRLLEAEGSAVVFAEVFQQVKGDMETVAVRLSKTDTGVVTVTIENQSIDKLNQVKKALEDLLRQQHKEFLASRQNSIDLNAVIKILVEIEKKESDQYERIKKLYDERTDAILNQALWGEEPAKKTEAVKPPWQRLLQGEDAKKAEEQEKQLA